MLRDVCGRLWELWGDRGDLGDLGWPQLINIHPSKSVCVFT